MSRLVLTMERRGVSQHARRLTLWSLAVLVIGGLMYAMMFMSTRRLTRPRLLSADLAGLPVGDQSRASERPRAGATTARCSAGRTAVKTTFLRLLIEAAAGATDDCVTSWAFSGIWFRRLA